MRHYYSYQDIPDRSFGGKADGLLLLSRNGFLVPPFFVIPDETIREIVSDNLKPENLFAAWNANVNPDKESLWALRSSANVEDGTVQSYAGMFTTVLNCTPDNLVNAFEEVMAGFRQVAASDYHQVDDSGIHVILQEMVPGEISGVGFSVNPMEQEEEDPLVSVIPGLGFKLVSGEENGMQIALSEPHPKAIAPEENYQGDVFETGYKTITLNGDTLFAKTKPYLNELRNGLIRLEQLKGFPVDTEFTIYKDTIYWLQVRPITSLIPKGDYTVWDNSNLAINYPGITLPLSSSYVLHSYGMAYRQMCRFLGSGDFFIKRNDSLFSNMVGTINGALYYHITAWQQLLFQMPFGNKTSRMITKMLGADDAKFKKPAGKSSPVLYIRLFFNLMKSGLFFGYYKERYLTQYERIRAHFEEMPLESKSHEALIGIYRQMECDLGKYWYPPMINGFFAMLSYNVLKKILSRSRMHTQYPNLLNDAITGIGDVVSMEIVRAFQDVVEKLHQQEVVKKIILEEDPREALEHIQRQYTEYHTLIMSYVDRFGERCDDGEMKMETVNYREDPSKFIALLKAHLSVPPHAKMEREPFNYIKVLKTHYKFNPIKFLLLKTGLKFTINRVRDRENFRFIRTKTFAMVRRIFREMDKQLLKQGLIAATGDSLYLQFEELMDPQLNNQYKTIISERKTNYETYQNGYHAVRYHEIAGAFYAIEKKSTAGQGELPGTGCSSGIAQGEALQITPLNIHHVDVQGKILVATFFEPGWIGLFARASGLIAERGSLLSHTAILCREMGIPLIVGATKATAQISNGEIIKMNGASGSIEKVSAHESV